MSTEAHFKNRKNEEKYRNIILGIAFLLIAVLTVGIFTYRIYPNDKEDLTFPGNDTTRAEIDIPQTNSLLFHPQNKALDQIQSGKVYYQDENGKLESTVNRDETGIHEELTGYDDKGNETDKLEIGYICDSIRYLKCAVIFKNKISVYETTVSTGKKNEETVTEYLISPQMKFFKGKTYTKL